MKGFREKCETPPFLALWAKMANFGQFLAKMGKTEIFFKKALGTFLSPIHVLPNCKVSEKSNEQFSRNCVTYERTDGQTRLLRSQRPVGRETKNQTIPMNQSEEKREKPHF